MASRSVSVRLLADVGGFVEAFGSFGLDAEEVSRPAAHAHGGMDASLPVGSCSDTDLETKGNDHV